MVALVMGTAQVRQLTVTGSRVVSAAGVVGQRVRRAPYTREPARVDLGRFAAIGPVGTGPEPIVPAATGRRPALWAVNTLTASRRGWVIVPVAILTVIGLFLLPAGPGAARWGVGVRGLPGRGAVQGAHTLGAAARCVRGLAARYLRGLAARYLRGLAARCVRGLRRGVSPRRRGVSPEHPVASFRCTDVALVSAWLGARLCNSATFSSHHGEPSGDPLARRRAHGQIFQHGAARVLAIWMRLRVADWHLTSP